jgi:hypothetical protein
MGNMVTSGPCTHFRAHKHLQVLKFHILTEGTRSQLKFSPVPVVLGRKRVVEANFCCGLKDGCWRTDIELTTGSQ